MCDGDNAAHEKFKSVITFLLFHDFKFKCTSKHKTLKCRSDLVISAICNFYKTVLIQLGKRHNMRHNL